MSNSVGKSFYQPVSDWPSQQGEASISQTPRTCPHSSTLFSNFTKTHGLMKKLSKVLLLVLFPSSIFFPLVSSPSSSNPQNCQSWQSKLLSWEWLLPCLDEYRVRQIRIRREKWVPSHLQFLLSMLYKGILCFLQL